MIYNEVQFGNILCMCLRDLAIYIFYRHLRRERFGFVCDSKERYKPIIWLSSRKIAQLPDGAGATPYCVASELPASLLARPQRWEVEDDRHVGAVGGGLAAGGPPSTA